MVTVPYKQVFKDGYETIKGVVSSQSTDTTTQPNVESTNSPLENKKKESETGDNGEILDYSV